MLSERLFQLAANDNRYVPGKYETQTVPTTFASGELIGHALLNCSDPSNESPEPQDDSLDETARTEREYVRSRLREELQREPSEDEVDEWLRQHTEGY
jgi:hypothetical protein